MTSDPTRRPVFDVLAALAVLALTLPAMLFTGCSKPQTYGPALVRAPADPTGEIQSRLLQDARAQFAEGRYETAVRSLRRLIDTYPQSPRLLEARLWLARSYEQTGNFTAALDLYRLVARSTADPGLSQDARQHIAALEPLVAALPRDRVAVLLPVSRLSSDLYLQGWFRDLAQSGVATVVLDVARDAELPAVERVAAAAHQQGLSVMAGLFPRRMHAPDQDATWADAVYDPSHGQVRPSESLDLFHPSVQQYLVSLSSALAARGVDGILFRADAPGPLEGFGPSARQTYERDFSTRLEPATLYTASDQKVPPPHGTRSAYSPEFWRWTGWKARETLKLFDRIRRTVRARRPALSFMLELHPEAVGEPVQALAQYSEDLLEAKRVRFDAYLFGLRPSQEIAGVPVTASAIAARAIDLIGQAERVWVTVPLPAGGIERMNEAVRPAQDRASLPRGVGLLYRLEPGSVP